MHRSVVHGVHDFKIPNFNAVQRSHGVSQATTSATFKVGGHDWRIRLYPSGNATVEGDDEYVSVFLQLVSNLPAGTTCVKTSVRFMIGDPSGTSLLKVSGCSHNHTSESRSWGYEKLISLKDAKSKYVVHDGSLTVRCEVDLTKEPEPYTSRASAVVGAGVSVTVPPSEISTQLEQLLASENGSDLSFLVEEENEIRAHKLVIAARAPALHEAVVATNNKQEDDHAAEVVRVDDMKAAVFKAVLHFIYTDELLPGDGTRLLAGDMLTAACRFGLTRMKAMCENLLCESLTKDNVLATAKLARRHHCKGLEDYCIDFASTPDVAKELLKTFISSDD
ncbi:BTB/POZ and MATH domain-containing protein 1-like [Aegilops tauschii subsp. strangulata]|uniref:Speckle-type POZ protein-like protein n=1 Tax=Aegilops tauschii TaxID=37682 RepID=M8C7C1_AEGTA|nr:BTB/POZ and MATH domain-containing protein 1-like [Aegilops tauschii subsp. strangulata]XP_044355320.1 BTB/POZ and MATH domain-containing protein 1-like [Triticum aestivum]